MERMKPVIVSILALLLASPALADRCVTQEEARADAMIGFFTTQAVAEA